MISSAVQKEVQRYTTKALDKPEWFFEDFLRFSLLPWQYHFVNAVLDVRRKHMGLPCVVNKLGKPRVTVRSCHGVGKTQVLAGLAHIWNFTNYGCRIAATAPKQDQLIRRLMPRYRRAMRDAPDVYKYGLVKVKGREVVIGGNLDWGMALETAVDPDSLSGYHDEPQLFLIDEASSKRLDPLYPTIEGALTTPGSCLAEIGNPTRMTGEFYQHHNRSDLESMYYRMHISYRDAGKLMSSEWVETMRIKYGEDSPVFKVRVLGEFASFDEAILIPLDYIEDAYALDWESDGSHPTLRVSVDVADGGADATLITVAKHYTSFKVILKQKEFRFAPSVAPIESAKAAITLFEAFGGDKDVDDFVIDANGVGAGTAGVLINDGYNVIRYVGMSKSDNTERWRNRRVQCALAMYEAFRNDTIVVIESGIDNKEDFEKHLMSVKRTGENNQADDIETKEKVKADAGFSPDRFDSLAMQFISDVPEQLEDAGVFEFTAVPLGLAHYDASL